MTHIYSKHPPTPAYRFSIDSRNAIKQAYYLAFIQSHCRLTGPSKMCGRYALGIVSASGIGNPICSACSTLIDAFPSQRASFVRHQFEDQGMPVADAPDDDEIRQTYNFAPGYHGLVYRADVPDYGAGNRHQRQHRDNDEDEPTANNDDGEDDGILPQIEEPKETRYKLQAMKWGG